MKLIHFATIAAAALANLISASTTYTFTPPTDILAGIVTAAQGIPAGVISPFFYRGVILGLQEDSTNTAHQCYQSYLGIEAAALGVPAYIVAISSDTSESNSLASTFISSIYLRPATYLKLIKKGSELGTIFFNMYTQCYFDDIIIAVGRTINSFSGGFNTLMTSAVYALNLLNFADTANPMVIMSSIVTTSSFSDDDLQAYGLQFSTIIKNLANVKVPEAQYQDF